ncbi:hypothetical protein EYF80_003960 [Liparis tanakae]|uniref:Uncharacterized protein n=1 Tax=Liparis tanakae TaxID=230148 RepID=A0A4Z2J7W4_9TELE|nr:hypothetical protein EYF80_003960 [Liparis tanakae]
MLVPLVDHSCSRSQCPHHRPHGGITPGNVDPTLLHPANISHSFLPEYVWLGVMLHSNYYPVDGRTHLTARMSVFTAGITSSMDTSQYGGRGLRRREVRKRVRSLKLQLFWTFPGLVASGTFSWLGELRTPELGGSGSLPWIPLLAATVNPEETPFFRKKLTEETHKAEGEGEGRGGEEEGRGGVKENEKFWDTTWVGEAVGPQPRQQRVVGVVEDLLGVALSLEVHEEGGKDQDQEAYVPPRRSMRTIRKICRKRMLRRAEVAKMLPCVPAAITAKDATNTMKSVKMFRKETHREEVSRLYGQFKVH